MDKRKQTLDTLTEMIDNLERLDVSFLVGEEKADAEYSINETIIDIQDIEAKVILEPLTEPSSE